MLPLLGAEGVIHDWDYILGRLHMLNWGHVVGNLIYTTGLVVLGVSVGGILRFPGGNLLISG